MTYMPPNNKKNVFELILILVKQAKRPYYILKGNYIQRHI